MRVRLEQGIYEVIDTKENIEAFNDNSVDSFFIRAESICGLPIALVEKKDVIEVLE